MDEELHDPFGEHAQRGRGPSVPPAGRAPVPPVGPPVPQTGDTLGLPLGPPVNDWPVWTGFAALFGALVLAAVGGLIVDIPAIAAGVKISSSHTPPGLELADTVVQDVAFVLTVVLFAQLGGRAVRSWQFGLCPTPARRAAGLVVLTILAFLLFSVIWAAAVNVPKEKLLEQLGTNQTTLLLALSALLTTVIAPISEEILFRGYIFAALSKWKGWLPAAAITGVLFGGVHAGSAPVADLIPLALLGFALCALYRRTGSLYPCIAAHSLNNSLAFGVLEKWGWQIPLLMFAALVTIGLAALIARQVGLISEAPPRVPVVPTAYDPPDGL